MGEYGVKFYYFDEGSHRLVREEEWSFTVKPLRVVGVDVGSILEQGFLVQLKAFLFRREKGMSRQYQESVSSGWSMSPSEFTEEDMKEIRKLWLLEEL